MIPRSSQTGQLADAYAACLRQARQHYENFPVASFALPRSLREPIAVIYAFARTADDLADEGSASSQQRLDALNQYRDKLAACAQGTPCDDPIFIALGDVLTTHDLPVQLLEDLLTAFSMDVTTKRYQTFADLLFYCRHSADPIGRLLLHLSRQASPENLVQSDAVCTSLQLINFWQDLAQDYDENNRIYVPEEDLNRFGVTEGHFRNKLNDHAMHALMAFQTDRARELMHSGSPLGRRLPGRLGFEVRLTVNTGLAIADALSTSANVFARPRLSKGDWARSIWRALLQA